MQRSNKTCSADNSYLLGLFLLLALKRRGGKEQNGLVLEAGNFGTGAGRYLPNTEVFEVQQVDEELTLHLSPLLIAGSWRGCCR